MGGEWCKYEVNDLIEKKKLFIGDGYRAKNVELSSAGLPFARAGNISDGFQFEDADCFPENEIARVGNKVSQPGDVVFTSKGTVGRFAFVLPTTPRFIYSPQLCYWRSLDPEVIDPRFLYCWMSGREFFIQYKGVAGQTDMAEYVSLIDQRHMKITLPEVEEQRAIARILGTLDDKIELNRRMNETLEEMTRAVFKSWFVDFDPVSAQFEGHDTGLPRYIADLFPGTFEESDLGEIPKGWKVCTLADLSLLNPATWQKKKRPATINYVDLSNTKWGLIEAVQSFGQQDAPSRAQRILQPGDTIVGTVRPGNGSFAFIFEEGLTGSTGFAVLHPLKVEYAELVYFTATAAENIEALSHVADGGAYPAVRPEIVAATRVIKSDDAIIRSFSHLTGPLLAKIAENERESRTLSALRDTLLPKLVSGELRLKDAERLIGRSI